MKVDQAAVEEQAKRLIAEGPKADLEGQPAHSPDPKAQSKPPSNPMTGSKSDSGSGSGVKGKPQDKEKAAAMGQSPGQPESKGKGEGEKEGKKAGEAKGKPQASQNPKGKQQPVAKGQAKEKEKAKAKASPGEDQDPMGNEDVEGFFADFTLLREEARKLFGSGAYDAAIEKFQECLTCLDELSKDVGVNISEDEFILRVTPIFNNIAVCHKQKRDPENVIAYTTRVLESQVPDANVLAKSLMLRAWAFEEVNELENAKEDWLQVNELLPDNVEVAPALARIEEALNTIVIKPDENLMQELDAHKQKAQEFYRASILARSRPVRGLR